MMTEGGLLSVRIFLSTSRGTQATRLGLASPAGRSHLISTMHLSVVSPAHSLEGIEPTESNGPEITSLQLGVTSKIIMGKSKKES